MTPPDDFPIADYDRVPTSEILRRLPDLDRDDLVAVLEREKAGRCRIQILRRIDARLLTAPPAAAKPRTTNKKATKVATAEDVRVTAAREAVMIAEQEALDVARTPEVVPDSNAPVRRHRSRMRVAFVVYGRNAGEMRAAAAAELERFAGEEAWGIDVFDIRPAINDLDPEASRRRGVVRASARVPSTA